MNNPYADAIQQVREKLNYFRRQERSLIKAAQRHCLHHQVKRKITKHITNMVVPFGGTAPYTTTTYDIICVDCGKRLN